MIYLSNPPPPQLDMIGWLQVGFLKKGDVNSQILEMPKGSAALNWLVTAFTVPTSEFDHSCSLLLSLRITHKLELSVKYVSI